VTIPFVKAHGAQNDFLLTWADPLIPFTPDAARAICNRNTGVGADGWMLVEREPSAIRLLNSDGSEAELSGNGTRCAAALLVQAGLAQDDVRILTGAGPKHLRLISREGHRFLFEMNMGRPRVVHSRFPLPLRNGPLTVTILDVGNPQCAVVSDSLPENWRELGAEIERHPQFPNRSNVSFVVRSSEHAIDVRFYERGAGETMSSGTGSTGAAAAALHLGLVTAPLQVHTPAGPLKVCEADGAILLTGPVEIVAEGVFHYDLG
jgi:diaminopimelate epimerase